MDSEKYHFVCILKVWEHSRVVYVFDQAREYTAIASIFPSLDNNVNNSGMLLYLWYMLATRINSTFSSSSKYYWSYLDREMSNREKP